jgi:hypothetical protein
MISYGRLKPSKLFDVDAITTLDTKIATRLEERGVTRYSNLF